jgi:hypothetical protein
MTKQPTRAPRRAAKDLLHTPTKAPNDALFQQWLDQAGLSRAALSRALNDKNQNLLTKILNGDRQCTIGEAAFLSARLKVPFANVVQALGYDVPSDQVDIVGTVTGTGRVSDYPPNEHRVAAAPPDAPPGMVALDMQTSDSRLALYNGTLLYYVPAPGVLPGAIGHASVIRIGEEPAAMVGLIDKASTISRAAIRGLDGKTIRETSQLVSASPIEWMRST